MKKNMKIDGVIVEISGEKVLVDIGQLSEGQLNISDITSNGKVKYRVGDIIPVLLIGNIGERPNILYLPVDNNLSIKINDKRLPKYRKNQMKKELDNESKKVVKIIDSDLNDLIKFEELIKNDYKIFVDTSSLMQKDSDVVFFRYIAPLMYKYQQKLIIPKSVFNELQKHNYNNHPNIYKANSILNELKKFELYGQNSKFDEQFADNALISQFTSLRLKYNLCLITSDYSYTKDGNLSQDILDLKKSRSTDNINDIRVFNIKSENGEFREYVDTKNRKKKPIGTNTVDISIKREVSFQFNLPTTPKRNDTPLNPKLIPEEGQYVFDNNKKSHKLLKQIGRTGGEGSVYITDTGYF